MPDFPTKMLEIYAFMKISVHGWKTLKSTVVEFARLKIPIKTSCFPNRSVKFI